MGNLKFRVPLDNSNVPRIIAKPRILFLLAILISTIAILIPDISFAISMDDPKLVARETARIEKFKEKVKRDGDTLLLKNKSGSYISVKDSSGCKSYSTCFSLEFLDYFEDIGFFLVQSYYSEGGEFTMVSESDGKEYYIHEHPMFSPDRKHLITVPDDSDTGYNENGVFIWRIQDNKLMPEFSYEPTEYSQYRFVRWKSNKYIELKKWLRSSKGLCPETDFMIVPVDLRKEDDGWKLYENFSPDYVECDAN